MVMFVGGYTLADFSHTEVRGVDNTPPPGVYANLNRLGQYLSRLRERMRFHLTSVYRSPEVNRIVRGQPHSQHTLGLAADLVPVFAPPGYPVWPLELAIDIVRKEVGFDQLIHEWDRWIHVSVAPEGRPARGEVLIIDKDSPRGRIYAPPKMEMPPEVM